MLEKEEAFASGGVKLRKFEVGGKGKYISEQETFVDSPPFESPTDFKISFLFLVFSWRTL